MRATNSLARWGLAACLVGSVGLLQAQESGFGMALKARTGYAPETKDNLRRAFQGFGLNLDYGVGAGRVGLELGYFYKTGDPYVTTPDASKVPAGQQPIDTTKAVEDKRNEFSGFTVRLSYQQAINSSWDWQAGIQMGGRFKHQYVGDARSQNFGENWGAAAANSWDDLYNGTPSQGGLNVSPYVGVSWKIDKDSAFEINVLFQRYTALEYHHYAGTATEYGGAYPGWSQPPYGPVNTLTSSFPYDYIDKTDRTVPQLEFAYVFKF